MKKLRILLILMGLSILAVISTVFGMMMAVASDLPALENTAEYSASTNSVLLDDSGSELGRLTGNENRILVGEEDVSPMLRNAVISIEDHRFYEHSGVDYIGIARALWADLRQRSVVQGGSTITQQFVKNALAAQGDRTIFQKLRESALAYHLERQWPKQKILTQYLNTVYFGNGAYGVESAMRTYFGGGREYGPDDRVSRAVQPHQAALLAGMIASPAAYDPVQNPDASLARRNLILDKMLEQGMVTAQEHAYAVRQPLPTEDDITPPTLDSRQPYFTTWVTQQLVDRYGAGTVFGGGLRIQTSLDPELQAAAEEAISSNLAGIGPTSALVAIDNGTGEVKAMVGGTDYEDEPFNLATNGHRQPGSAIKPFTLIAALEQGHTPEETFISERKVLPDPNTKGGFVVENYEGNYAGVTTLRDATVNSDNSVYAELGLKVGPRRIASLARRMGIRTTLSTNPAMTLGGLEEGVTPLEMAFAYATIANRGTRRSGSLASSPLGPVAIDRVESPSGEGYEPLSENHPRAARVFPSSIGGTAIEVLSGVVAEGTGTAAQVDKPAWGKTGTTENYGDAWFVGSSEGLTVAVWVGYPDATRPMKTEYNGGPVAGGTYPARIWQSFMSSAIGVLETRDAERKAERAPTETGVEETTPAAPVESAPAPVEEPVKERGGGRGGEPVEEEPAPAPAPDQSGGAAQEPGAGGGGADQGGAGGGGDGQPGSGFPPP